MMAVIVDADKNSISIFLTLKNCWRINMKMLRKIPKSKKLTQQKKNQLSAYGDKKASALRGKAT